ncbi:beta-eliminating lyase-related protein [Flavobacterium amniphilum]|uniref:threonine aldolase family protein n=1 Tax=Flavobacterium amniphilum TaxID=1834035 RepID=UPI00202A4126|nr:beta-eliminating lyase-related protein [Flavobacterium amniphilum]MCL9804700.1 beta-eliminating lyase-related protein [Flavobacterium amniphilum]
MKKTTDENKRRDFLKKFGLSAVPFLLPAVSLNAMSFGETIEEAPAEKKSPVNFIYDGLPLDPDEYLAKLQEISKLKPIEPDFYGDGGATKQLEEEFAKLTGKEKAIYLPSGTMANQLAIKLLSGNNTKVIVPENSHVYRDEADAAQSVHGKRLIPVGEGKAYYELADLKNTIDYLNSNEVFKSGLGTVVIENPIRRTDGTFVPIDTIKEISNYCKTNNYKMHLDGARIHLAAAFSGISLSEYASYFDTVYISLYKYLNATGGAILCGDSKTIDLISHQIKILGGTVFQSWNNTAMALHYLNGIDQRWSQVVKTAQKLVSHLNKIEGVSIVSLQNGTNIYDLKLSNGIGLRNLAVYLYEHHNIWLGRANDKGIVKFTVNESLLTRDYNEILTAWKKGIEHARK